MTRLFQIATKQIAHARRSRNAVRLTLRELRALLKELREDLLFLNMLKPAGYAQKKAAKVRQIKELEAAVRERELRS